MSKVIIVDLPSLCFFTKKVVDSKLVLALMDFLPKLRNIKVLCNENAIALIFTHNTFTTESYLVQKFLEAIDPYGYSATEQISDIKVVPDLTCGETDIDSECKTQFSVMHSRLKDKEHAYLTFAGRWESEMKVLVTTANKKSHNHNVVIFKDCSDLDKFHVSYLPKLIQKKHYHDPYKLGGEDVAPFTLWDSNDEQPAKDLLNKAFADSDDENLFPHVLYGWDDKNGVWVKFNHNGKEGEQHNKDYHGYDLRNNELSEVPERLKEKYHHYSNTKADWTLSKKGRKK